MTLNAAAVADIDERFRKRYPSKPTSARTQSLSGRLYRSISWLKRATMSDGAPRFIALWIALNALYGLRPYGVGWDPQRTDLQEFTAFLDRFLKLEDGDVELRRLPVLISRDALVLIGSQFLWNQYWSGKREFQKDIADTKRIAQEALRNAVAREILLLVHPRLLVLRNQIFHGSAAERTRINLATLTPAIRLLESTLPVFLGLMIERGASIEWPALAYPPTGSPQEPRLHR